MKGSVVVDTPEDFQAWLKERAEFSQQQQQQAPAPVAAPPAPAAGGQSTIDQLKELGELKAQGILTEEEFAAQKAKLLNA